MNEKELYLLKDDMDYDGYDIVGIYESKELAESAKERYVASHKFLGVVMRIEKMELNKDYFMV